jgi:hypothetical protein
MLGHFMGAPPARLRGHCALDQASTHGGSDWFLDGERPELQDLVKTATLAG